MKKLWRKVCSWFRKKKPVVKQRKETCGVDHTSDHVCWDDLSPEPLPGNRCWYCNKCGRSWHTPNVHEFPSGYQQPRAWAEYQYPERKLIIYTTPPNEVVKILDVVRKKKNGNTT